MTFDDAKKMWEKDMLSFGLTHANNQKKILTDWKGGKPNPDFNPVYYDGARVFYQIYDYTKDAKWLDAAKVSVQLYRDTYLLPNQGRLPGYWIFPQGLAEDFRRTGDTFSKDSVMLLSNNSSYATDLDSVGHGSYLVSANGSRECAYAIMAHLVAESLGKVREKKTLDRIRNLYGHFDQWFISKTWVPQPFMVGLACEALMMWEVVSNDDKVFPAIKLAGEGLMETHWRESNQSFVYADPPTNMTLTTGAPDLNLLILPIYGYLAKRTGDIKYQQWGDKIFIGGRVAWIAGNKQFNQNYRNSFNYVRDRMPAPIDYFVYKAPTPGEITRNTAVQKAASSLVTILWASCPDNAQRSLAIQKLEECVLYAGESISKLE